MMENSPYNLLPAAAKIRFRVSYSELVSPGGITLIKNASEKWGALIPAGKWTVTGYRYLVRAEYESIGFHKSRNLLEAVSYEKGKWNKKTNRYSYFDPSGKKVWEAPRGMYPAIDSFGNMIIEVDGKFGLLDTHFGVAIEPVYDQLVAINEKFFRIQKNRKYGVVDAEGNCVLEALYVQIMNRAGEKVMARDEAGQWFSIELETGLREEKPFERVFRATSNSYGAPVESSLQLLKAFAYPRIIPEEDEDSEEEMVLYRGKWGIVEAGGQIVIPIDYDYIDFLENPDFFKVCQGELNFTDEMDDEEGVYRKTLIPGTAKWGIIDRENRIVVPIEYDWIDEVGHTLWCVHLGGKVFYNDNYQEDYWMCTGSKLGVFNKEQLVVPVEYDSIHLHWYLALNGIRVSKRDNGIEKTDVYTFDGKNLQDLPPKKTWK